MRSRGDRLVGHCICNHSRYGLPLSETDPDKLPEVPVRLGARKRSVGTMSATPTMT